MKLIGKVIEKFRDMELIEKAIVGVVVLGIVGGSSYLISPSSKKYERLFEEGKKPIVGTVLKESYQNTLSSVPEYHYRGIISEAHSNETVKLESKYTLKIQTDDGRILGVSVIDGDDFDGKPVKKESLDIIIDEGTRISFPSGNMKHGKIFSGGENRDYPNETYFTPETQAGNKRADRIKILPKK